MKKIKEIQHQLKISDFKKAIIQKDQTRQIKGGNDDEPILSLITEDAIDG